MKTGLLYLMLTVMACCTSAAHGQGRSGGSSGGMPSNMPMPRDITGPRDLPGRGPPEWNDNASSRGSSGLEQADIARDRRLSKTQSDRATLIARDRPADYELDRNGALAVRGEVLTSGLEAYQLARIERAGFKVIRRSEIAELGITVEVVEHDDLSASQAIKRLRRIDPDGRFDLNHVYFESSAGPAQGLVASVPMQSSLGARAVVGMIDTGVAPIVESSARVRIVRRSFSSGPAVAAHGTAVAALLARERGMITIYAADIFGVGMQGGTAELLARALGWMASQRVPVINVSMVGPSNGLVGAATNAMIVRGYIIVAPVGNDGPRAELLYPASYPGVIAVSAAGADGRLLPEASRVKRVDFVGPGIATVPDPSGRMTVVRGTSFAAPIVSRQLADLVTSPNPGAARRALSLHSSKAIRRRASGNAFGRGLVGIDLLAEVAK